MRAAVYYNNNDIRLEELPIPEIGPGELLLRTEASGICGSDVLEWYRIKKAPLVLGHEIAGEVVDVGSDVKKFSPGDRVVSAHHVPCQSCRYCLSGHETCCDTLRSTNFFPGGFSEFIRIPAINVEKGTFSIPDDLSYDEATFHEPLGCILRAGRISGMTPGRCIVVFGCGIAGLLQIHFARYSGAGLIVAVEPIASRRKAALRFGANFAVSPDERLSEILRDSNDGRLADLVFLATGAEFPQAKALECVERGGIVMYFAPTETNVEIPVSINHVFFRNDVTLTTSYGAAPIDSIQALKILSFGSLRINDMITHRLPLHQTGEGFRLVSNPGESIKVIIEPQK